MKKKTFYPENCLWCWLSERQGTIYRCKFYGLGYPATLEEKPPYCKVKSITVEERREIQEE
jgi:hypothetical protein